MKKVTRDELLKSKEFWMVKIQNDLYGVIEDHMKEHGYTRTALAEKTGFTKGYITQVLKGDFDHKISKLVELSLAVDKVPVIKYVDIEKVIEDDKKHDNPLLSLHLKPIHFVTVTIDSQHFSSIKLPKASPGDERQNEVEINLQLSNSVRVEI